MTTTTTGTTSVIVAAVTTVGRTVVVSTTTTAIATFGETTASFIPRVGTITVAATTTIFPLIARTTIAAAIATIGATLTEDESTMITGTHPVAMTIIDTTAMSGGTTTAATTIGAPLVATMPLAMPTTGVTPEWNLSLEMLTFRMVTAAASPLAA